MKCVHAGSPTCLPYAARSWAMSMAEYLSCSGSGLQQAGPERQDSRVLRSPAGAWVTRGNSAAYILFHASRSKRSVDDAGRERHRVKDALHLGRQRALHAVGGPGRAGDVGEPEQVPALGGVQPERARDRVEHLDARVDRAALLQPGVPGDADPGQLRELLPPQPGGAAAGADGEADVLRADPLPAAAQERGELGPARRARGLPVVGSGCRRRRSLRSRCHAPMLLGAVPGGASTRITRLLVPA